MINDGLAVKLAERNRGADRDLTFIPTGILLVNLFFLRVLPIKKSKLSLTSLGVHALMPLSATRYEFMSDPPRYMCIENANDNYSNLWCYEVSTLFNFDFFSRRLVKLERLI